MRPRHGRARRPAAPTVATWRPTVLLVALVAITASACGSPGDGTPARPSSPAAAPTPSTSTTATDSFTLTSSTDICAAFDAAAMGALAVTTPSRSPAPDDSQPICVFPGAAQGDGPIGIQAEPDQTLDGWLQFRTHVIRLEVAGGPAASAQFDDLPCTLGIELGGGVLSLSQSGTADDCSYLLPAAEYAVAGVLAAG